MTSGKRNCVALNNQFRKKSFSDEICGQSGHDWNYCNSYIKLNLCAIGLCPTSSRRHAKVKWPMPIGCTLVETWWRWLDRLYGHRAQAGITYPFFRGLHFTSMHLAVTPSKGLKHYKLGLVIVLEPAAWRECKFYPQNQKVTFRNPDECLSIGVQCSIAATGTM